MNRNSHWSVAPASLVLALLWILHNTDCARSDRQFARAQSSTFDSLYSASLKWASRAGKHVRIYYKGVDEKYVDAAKVIIDECYSVYEDSLKVGFPLQFKVSFAEEPGWPLQLFQNGYDWIVWQLGSDSVLAAPANGGAHNVYGPCHELAHTILAFDDHDFNEAWADHMAAFVALPYLHRKLGDNAWPDPYDYTKSEGKERTLKYVGELRHKMDYAMKVLYEIGGRFGNDIYSRLIAELRPQYLKNGPIRLSDLKSKLIELTGDKSIGPLFDRYDEFKGQE